MEIYSDDRYQLPGKLFTLQNMRYRRPPKASKRHGYTPMTAGILGGGAFSGVQRIDYHNNERLVYTEDGLYGYSEKPGQWALRGKGSDAFVTPQHVYFDQETLLRSATVEHNQGVWLYLWGEAAFNAIVTDDNGVILRKEPGGSSPKFNDFTVRCFSMGDYIYVIRRQTTALEWSRINVTSGSYIFSNPAAFGTAVTIGGQNLYDAVAVQGATNRFVMAWTDGADDIHVGLFDDANPPANVGGFTQPTITTTCDRFLTILAVAGEQIWVLWGSSTGGVIMAVVNISSGAVTTGPVAIAAAFTDTNRGTLIRHNSTQAIAAYEIAKETGSPPPSRYLPYTRYQRRNTSLVLQGTERILYDCALASRGWIETSDVGVNRYYIATVFQETEQGTGFVIQIGDDGNGELDPRWCATFGRGIASGFLSDAATVGDALNDGNRNIISNAVLLSNRQVAFVGLSKQKFIKAKLDDKDSIRFHRGVTRYIIDYGNGDLFSAVGWGRGYFIAGGRPSWYDGSNVHEHGFAWYPSFNRDADTDALPPAATNNDDLTETGGAAFTSGQTFRGVAIYEAEDANAQIHRSGYSRVMLDTIGGATSNLRFTVKTGLLTERLPPASSWWSSGATPPKQVYFRTPDGVGEAIYYRADARSGKALWPNPTAATNFDDFGAAVGDDDVALQLRDVLYVTGDILPNDGTPPCKFCCVHGDRLWLLGTDDPKVVWFSQPYVSTEAPRFNQALTLIFPTEPLAAASMDDKLVVLSSDRVYIVTGDGPPATGGADVGFDIQLITTDVGIRDVRSLLQMPLGLMWRSDKGIVLLGRDLTLNYIGKDVSPGIDPDTFPLYTCVGAALLARRSEVRFLFNTGVINDAAQIWWYNYEEKVWGIDQFVSGEDGTIMNPVSCTMFGDTFAIATTQGVWQENANFDDEGSFVASAIVTRWITLNDVLQGWLEVDEIQFVGDYGGAHTVSVTVLFDFSSDSAETFSFTKAELEAQKAATGTRYQFSVTPRTRQCRSLQIIAADAVDTAGGGGPTEAMALSEIVIRGRARKGLAQLASAARH
jgi:hypothetical protein